MSTPMTVTARPGSRGRQLAAEAAEAAEVRDALTHPDVVALRVERVRARVDRFIWSGMILGLLFTMTNVQQFTATTIGAGAGSLGWWAAWLLDPTVSVILLGVLLAEREVCRWQIPVGPWARAAKWSLLAATYVMNTWESYATTDPAGIVLHSVPVLAVFVGAEAVTDCQDKLTEATHRAHTYATARADRKAAATRDKQAATGPATAPAVAVAGPVPAAPIAPPATPVFRAVAVRSDPAPAGRPAERSTDRSDAPGPGRPADRSDPPSRTVSPDRSDPPGPVRPAPARPDRPGSSRRSGPGGARPGTPKTDAQLVRAVRDLADRTGGPPSQYQLKQRFGIGSSRAARLLAELDDRTPAAEPATNGTARKEPTP